MKTTESAFPHPPFYIEKGKEMDWAGSEGMTLRDYFAAHALQALISSNKSIDGIPLSLPRDAGIVASVAYKTADAMLVIREGA